MKVMSVQINSEWKVLFNIMTVSIYTTSVISNALINIGIIELFLQFENPSQTVHFNSVSVGFSDKNDGKHQ